MTVPSIIDVVRVWMRREGFALHAAGAAMALEGDAEVWALFELIELVIDAKETSSGLIATIKAQRWDDEVTTERAVDRRLIEQSRAG